MKSVLNFFSQIIKESLSCTWTLFKIMIPALIVIKLLQEFGAIEYLSALMSPVMHWVSLPAELSLVWASTLLINIYAGLIVIAGMDGSFTVSQISVLGGMMLVAHALPIEGAIARAAGCPWFVSIPQRLIASFLFGFILSKTYQYIGFGQSECCLIIEIQQQDPSWMGWLLLQLKSLGLIFAIIVALVFLLKLLKILKIEKLMGFILSPALKLLGMAKGATNVTIIGITLGLTYGGGLLIAESQKGVIRKEDMFVAIILLNMLHSLIEDTLLVILIGADFYSVFFGRIIYAILLTSLISLVYRRFFVR